MKHKTLRTLLCVILTVCFCLSAIVPASAAGLFGGDSGAATGWDQLIRGLKDRFIEKNPGTDETPAEPMAGAGEEFIRIFHLDCGRKYFTVQQIKDIINQLAANHYTHIELAFGNDGFRFLLDDMAIPGYTTFTSEQVKSAIHVGNQGYYSADATELTESEMNTIIAYANGKGIGVIPMIDVPGHTNALVTAMQQLKVSVSVFTSNENSAGYETKAFDVSTPETVEFVKAFVKKYIDYFAEKGCAYFNIAADECGYDNFSSDQYTALADMLKYFADYIDGCRMKMIMFNDGFRSNGTLLGLLKSYKDKIIVSYWTHSGYQKAETIANEGFKVINTHNKWYYVAGNEGSGWYGYKWALANMANDNTGEGNYSDCTVCDSGYKTSTGCMVAFWCDNPGATVNYSNLKTYIETLPKQNPNYFKAASETPLPSIVIGGNNTELTVGENVIMSTSDGSLAAWSSSNPDVLTLKDNDAVEKALLSETSSVTVQAVGAGEATITADLGNGNTISTAPIKVKTADTAGAEIINVTVGGTDTHTQTNVNFSANKEQIRDTSGNVIAEYSAEYKMNIPGGTERKLGAKRSSSGDCVISDDNGNYLVIDNSGNITNTTKINQATVITYSVNSSGYNTTYSFKGNGYYLTTEWGNNSYNLKAATSNSTWQYSSWNKGYYQNYSYYLRFDNGSWTVAYGDSSNAGYPYSFTETTTPPTQGTVVTFTGLAAGNATVTIGNTTYTINVTAEDLAGVTPLPIQLWITNNTIEGSGTNAKTTGSGWGGDNTLGGVRYISVPATTANATSSVYSEAGMLVVDAFAAAGMTEPLKRYEWGGTRFITAKDDKPAQDLAFWTGRIHNSTDSNIQQVWGGDFSNSGEAFNYVRYYGGKWAVSADGKTGWTTVTGAGSTGTYSGCTQQLAAYYMTRTKITDEVTTDVADWGKPKGSSDYNSQVEGNFVLLDFAVKYEGGTRNPDTFPVDSKTLAYHCASGDAAVGTYNGTNYRKLFNFRGIETSDYEVYMVTVTMTDDLASTQLTSIEAKNGYEYKGEEKVVWAIDAGTYDKSGLNPYESLSGNYSFDVTDTNNCIGGDPYVRGVDVYNKHGALITYYIRAVQKEDSLTVNYFVKGVDTPFYSYFINVDANATHGKNKFNEEIALDTTTGTSWKGNLVNGDVKNIKGNTEWVSADLATMPAIGAQYRFSEYMCVQVVRESDKVVNLYYTFTANASFVVDFGLPITITPTDLSQNLEKANITGAFVSDTPYANVKVDGKNIIYQLNKPLDRVDTFTITYKGENKDTLKKDEATYTINIIPATNVYYEENFINVAENSTVWTDTSIARNPDQALEKSDAQKYVYGYDPEYATATDTYSMGNAKKATLTLSADAFSTKTSEALTFTFEGDGYDIISECGTDVGLLVAYTYRVENGKETLKYIDIMDNYFCGDDTYITGNGITGNGILAAQVPVIRKLNLSDGYGKYKVKIIGYLRQTAGVLNVSDSMAAQSYAAMASVDSPVVYDYESSTNAIVDEILADLGVANLADVDVRVSFVDKNSILNGGTGVFAKETVQDMKNDLRSAYTVQANEGYKAGSAVVYVDAFRVYNPLGHDTTNLPTAYNDNHENSLKYESMYDYLKNSGSAVTNNELVDNALIYVEYDGDTNVATVKDYKNQGPDNEIYLTAEQNKANYIGIILQGWVEGKSTVMVSAKSVLGNPALWVKTQSSQSKVADVKTKTELYYDLSNFVKWDSTINNWVLVMSNQSNSQSVLSISGIKISKDCSAGSSQFFAESVKDSLTSTGTSTYNPDPFSVTSYGNVLFGDEVSLNVKVDGSANSLKLYGSDGKEVAAHFSWNNQKAYNRGKVTFKSFTIYFDAPTVTTETAFTYKVVAVNADGIESNPIEITITVVQ